MACVTLIAFASPPFPLAPCTSCAPAPADASASTAANASVRRLNRPVSSCSLLVVAIRQLLLQAGCPRDEARARSLRHGSCGRGGSAQARLRDRRGLAKIIG